MAFLEVVVFSFSPILDASNYTYSLTIAVCIVNMCTYSMVPTHKTCLLSGWSEGRS